MDTGSTVFITGSTGFIGGALISRLLADGREVRALVRTVEAAERARSRGIDTVIGDLANLDALSIGVEGVDTVFHVAGVNEMCATNQVAMTSANVTGTLAVFEAAAATGVSCMVYTSSAVTIGHRADGSSADERDEHDRQFVSHYERTKYEAEVALFAAASQSSVRVVAVNPVSVQGPGRTGGSAKLLLQILKSRRSVLPATTISLVDVADCVEGHVRAESRGLHLERYLLSGAVIDTREIAILLASVVGEKRRAIVVPTPLVKVAAMPLAWLVHRLGSTSICPEMVRTLLKGHAYDGAKATRELGLEYRAIRDTMTETVAWYRSEGLLKR